MCPIVNADEYPGLVRREGRLELDHAMSRTLIYDSFCGITGSTT